MNAPDHAPSPAARPPRATPPGWQYTAGLVVGLALVAAWAMPRAIQAGDAGEFATVMLTGGVPHPSGYPWMRLLGLVARMLWGVGVPPAIATALPPALCALAGFGVLHRVALRAATPQDTPPSAGSAIVATFSIGLVSTASFVVLHAFDCEVWGPLVLAAAVVLWLSQRPDPSPLWLGLAFGLAVSHHLTLVLLAPVVIGAVWPRPWSVARLGQVAGLGLLGGVLGLGMFSTLAIGGAGGWQWGDPDSLAGLLHHATRGDYGVFSLSLHTERPSAWSLIGRALGSLGSALTAGLAPHPLAGGAVVVAVLALAWRSVGSLRLPVRIGLIAAVVASGGLFPLAQNIAPGTPFGRWILERFDILPTALLGVLVAAGLARVIEPASRRTRAAAGLCVGAGLLIIRQLIFTAWNGVPSDNPHVQSYAEDALATPTPGARALVIGSDDHRIFPILYAKTVLGAGEGVVYVDASMLGHEWYRAWLRKDFPDLPDHDKPIRLLDAVARDPRFSDVELYLANDFSVPSSRVPRAPAGVLWRVLRPGEIEPSLDEVLAQHRAALSRTQPVQTETLVSGHPFAIDLLTTYTEGTRRLAMALEAAGRPEDAEALLSFAVARLPSQ